MYCTKLSVALFEVRGSCLRIWKTNCKSLNNFEKVYDTYVTFYLWPFTRGTRYSSWLRYYATNRKVAGSISDEDLDFSIDLILHSRTMALGATQPRRLTTLWASTTSYRDSITLNYGLLQSRLHYGSVWLQIGTANNVYCKLEFKKCLPPLCSSGQSSWLQIQRSRVQFSLLPDFLRSSGSGTGSTHPREYNWGATWKK
jgi:hypothetical protein